VEKLNMQHTVIDSKTGEIVEVVEMESQPEPTSEEYSEEETASFLEGSLTAKALAMVLADLIEKQFNVTQTVARQQVRSRFKGYMKELLDQQAGG